jgi:hypothetical protein
MKPRAVEATVPLAALRAMLDAMEAYVPIGQRPNARKAALGAGIGYAYAYSFTKP